MIRETGRVGLPTSAGCSYSDGSVASRLQPFANSSDCVGTQGLHSECGRFDMFHICRGNQRHTIVIKKKKKSLPLDPAMNHFIRIFAVYIFLNFQFFSYDIFPGGSRGRFSTMYYNQDFVLISCLFPCLRCH